MTIENIFTVATVIVAFCFGELAKIFNWVENKYLPYQSLATGIVSAILYYILIDSSSFGNALIIAISGLVACGYYDMTQTNKKG